MNCVWLKPTEDEMNGQNNILFLFYVPLIRLIQMSERARIANRWDEKKKKKWSEMGWRWNLMSPVDGNNTDAVDMQPKDEFHLVQKYFFPTTAHTRQKWKEENLWNFRGQRSAREWEDQWRSKSKKNVDQVGPLIHRYVRSFQSHFALLVQIESLFKVSSRVVYIFLPFSRRSNIDWFSWTSLNSAYSKYRLVGKNNLSRIIFYIVFKFQMTSNTVSCFTRTEQVSTQNAKQQQFSYFFFERPSHLLRLATASEADGMQEEEWREKCVQLVCNIF